MDTEFKVVAYMHRKYDHCVSVDPYAYQDARELVLLNDVIDIIDYLEKGLAEWRSLYLSTVKGSK